MSVDIYTKNHDLKEEMILCLVELVFFKDKTVENQEIGEFRDWTDLIERSGICDLKQMTFQLFHALI